MGKQTQNMQTNGLTHNNKTNINFKWGRMFHLLDYHHWHYIKKVMANKKRPDGSNAKDADSQSEAYITSDINQCSTHGSIEKTQLQEHSLHESLPSPSTQKTKLPPSLTTSPSTKSSRATRIKKMIAREVSKRKSRHRRSSTCPVSSEHIHNHLEVISDHNNGVVEVENGEILRHNNMYKGEDACGLCTTKKIECQLGDKKQVGKKVGLLLNDMNLMFQENQNDSLNQTRLYKNVRRSMSLQQSREFVDVMDVMSMNKRFFVRVMDDQMDIGQIPTLENVLPPSSKRKTLAKFGTFPNKGASSCTKDTSFDGDKVNDKTYNKDSDGHKHSTLHEIGTTLHDNQAPRIRFRDLRHKIKHVIKESKKDRHIIAMDAVLHKVPYGQRVPEESTKETPCVIISTCETNMDIKAYKRRSPSLDESFDKYCHLFETTSFGKDDKIDSDNKSRLRVMDDNSNRSNQKRLGRMFSSPDLHLFLTNQNENYGGDRDISLRTPNRRILSFRESKEPDVLNMDFGCNENGKTTIQEEFNDDDVSIKVNSMTTIDANKDYSTDDESNVTANNNLSSSEVISCESDDGVTTAKPVLVLNMEPTTTSILEDNIHQVLQETTLEDLETTTQQDQSKELQIESSPTFTCTKTDERNSENSVMHISPSLHHIQVENENIEEFNYVRDILQLSGYLGPQLLGTWYSSEQPLDPSIYIEFETCSIIEPKFEDSTHKNHLLLFDLINETLLAIYERSISYWCAPLSCCSRTHPMPKGYRILYEVWSYIYWYITCSKPELDPSLDYITAKDLAKDDKWMNLQFDAECVGLEVEEMIFEDLLDEFTS